MSAEGFPAFSFKAVESRITRIINNSSHKNRQPLSGTELLFCRVPRAHRPSRVGLSGPVTGEEPKPRGQSAIATVPSESAVELGHEAALCDVTATAKNRSESGHPARPSHLAGCGRN